MSVEQQSSDARTEYLACVSTLVRLDAAGLGESVQAEDLRGAMDALWHRLSPADQVYVRTLIVKIINALDPTVEKNVDVHDE